MSIKKKAKLLVNKNVEIKIKKKPQSNLPGVIFYPYTLNALLEEVYEDFVKIKKDCGMADFIPFEDEYLMIEDIIEIERK